MESTFIHEGREWSGEEGQRTLVAGLSTWHVWHWYDSSPAIFSSAKNSRSVSYRLSGATEAVSCRMGGATAAAASADHTDAVDADVAHRAISSSRSSCVSPRRVSLGKASVAEPHAPPLALRVVLFVDGGGGGCLLVGTGTERDRKKSTRREWPEQESHVTWESNRPVLERGASAA